MGKPTVAAPGNPKDLLFIRTAFSPDGQTLAFSGFEGKVSRTGKELTFQVDIDGTHGIGTMSATVGDGTSKWRMLAGGLPGDVAFSPDGMFVWAKSDDQLVRVALADPKNARVVVADVADCALSGNGRWALVKRGGPGGYVVADLESASVGEPLAALEGEEDRTLVIDEQAMPLALYVRGERLVIFDIAKHVEVGGMAWPASRERVASSAVGKGILVVGAEKGGLFAWSLVDKRQIQMPVMTATSAEIRTVAVAPDGSLVVYGADNGTVGIVDFRTGGVSLSLDAHTAPVKGVAFSRDGQKVATVALDEVRVWDVARARDCPDGPCASAKLMGAEDSRSMQPAEPEVTGERHGRSETIADPKTSKPSGWPPLAGRLSGGREVRVRNPNAFSVLVAVRSEGRGADFEVAPAGVASVYVPDGQYDIYFNYSSQPEAVYQGDSFSIQGNGVEIRIVQVVNGNYGIRRVR